MTNKEQLDFLFNFFQIIVVNSSEGKIETSEVVKDKNGFKTLKKYKNYSLKKTDCNFSLFSQILNDITIPDKFIESEQISIKYKFNFFQNLFFNKRKFLFEKIKHFSKNCSWMIVPNFLSSFVSKELDFICNESYSEKNYLGSLNEIMIFLNPDLSTNDIYFGNYDSFKVIINRDTLDYELIDKLQIKVLKLI